MQRWSGVKLQQVFLTAVWGFEPEQWAAIGFTQAGNRDSLLREYRVGDFVAIFGTMGPETAEGDRGKLLGLVQLAPKAIQTKHMVQPDLWQQKLADQGAKKWIAGLPMSKAWRFDPRVERSVRKLLPRFTDRKYNRTLASRYELLDQDEAAMVISLGKTEVDAIYKSEEMIDQELRLSELEGMKARRNGPPPAFVQSLRVMEDSPAVVYGLVFKGDLKIALGKPPHEIAKKFLFKIGWSVDSDQRCRQINTYMPDEQIMGWKPVVDPLPCHSRTEAYLKEQSILRALNRHRHKGEMVLCTDDELRRVWNAHRLLTFSDSELSAAQENTVTSMVDKL